MLERVVLGVSDLEGAVAALPHGLAVERPSDDLAAFEAPEGLGLGLTPRNAAGVDYDIDHVVLRVREPERTLDAMAELGFERDGDRLAVADKHLRLERGDAREGDRPLLNHLALLVDSAEACHAEAKRRGLEIAEVVDAPNTLAVFVWGPERIKLEYVEHKPGFSLT